MKQKQAVKVEKLAYYEQAAIKSISFETAGGAVKVVDIETSIGPLQIQIDSYSVVVYEPAMVTKYRTTIIDTRGQLPDFHKDFPTEHERDMWGINFDKDDRFKVALSEYTEMAS